MLLCTWGEREWKNKLLLCASYSFVRSSSYPLVVVLPEPCWAFGSQRWKIDFLFIIIFKESDTPRFHGFVYFQRSNCLHFTATPTEKSALVWAHSCMDWQQSFIIHKSFPVFRKERIYSCFLRTGFTKYISVVVVVCYWNVRKVRWQRKWWKCNFIREKE